MEYVKSKTRFVVLSIRKNVIPIIFLIFTLCLVVFSRSNVSAAKDGLILWANSVVPSLLPFFIATELLSNTNIINSLGKLLNRFMRPIFNVPGQGAFAFFMGIISGYPTGAKIVSDFRNKGICTKTEAERLLSFTNNSGPLFIIGTVGISLFYDVTIGFLLFFTHILACISVGLIFRFWKYNKNEKSSTNKYLDNKIDEKPLGEIISNSIKNAINTVVSIGGFVVLFSVILSILNQSGVLNLISTFINPILNTLNIPTTFSKPIVSGIIELTNGVNLVSNIVQKNISTNIIITAFLLGFGSFSVVLQVYGIISKTDISIKPYIIGKFLQGILASFYTYIVLKNSMFFNLNIPTSNVINSNFINYASRIQINNYFILLSTFVIVIWLICFGKKIFRR